MLDSDLLLVGRGGGSFRTTAQELKTYVESGDGLVYRGAIDFTAAPVLDPNPPVVGDLYICLLYTSPSPRDYAASRMPSSA